MRLPNTTNETSFAVCFGDATALVLDAITVTGTDRRTKLTQALGRLDKAFAYADTPAEIKVATGLNSTIRNLESLGMDS